MHTACPLDCPDCCSLAVTIEHGRVLSIDGSNEAPTTGGYICGKVRRFDRRVYSDERLLYPAVRKGAKGGNDWTRITWDEALDLVALKMRDAADRHGTESVLPFYYGGSNGLLTNELEDARLFRRFGASKLARTVCAAPTSAATMALYGKMAGVSYPDYEHARLIVIWGANPSASGIHIVPYIRAAQKNGAKLVVIDPRRTALARQADIHLPLRPGTDLPVALAMIRSLFEDEGADHTFLEEHATGADQLRQAAEEWTVDRAADVAGISSDDLRTVIRWYAQTSPAVIRCGWGQERNRNGGSATMAIVALPAVAGKFGVRGGGYTMSNSAAWGIAAESLVNVPAPPTRTINMNQLGQVLTGDADPPVSVLFVYNCNPLSTMPDQNRVKKGLERDDLFTIVFDQVMTDTARYADLLLPATTFLEQYDIAKGYGAYHLHLVRPVIERVGEARPNQEVFRGLGVRLGLIDDAAAGDDSGEAGALLEAASLLPAAAREALLNGGPTPAPAGGHPIQFVDVMPKTGDERAHLYPDGLATTHGLYAYQPDPGTADFPFALISPSSEKTVSSTLAEFRPGVATVKIHPEDAAPKSIVDGDTVKIFNALGEVHCHASVTLEVRRGVLSLPKGLWGRSTLNGQTANALAPDSLTDLAGGACFNDARVQIELLGRH